MLRRPIETATHTRHSRVGGQRLLCSVRNVGFNLVKYTIILGSQESTSAHVSPPMESEGSSDGRIPTAAGIQQETAGAPPDEPILIARGPTVDSGG